MKFKSYYLIFFLALIVMIFVCRHYYLPSPQDFELVTGINKPLEEKFPEDDDLKPFANAAGLMGYKNNEDQIVIAPQFAMAWPFSIYGIANVLKEGRKEWYVIDRMGRVLFQSYFFDNGPDYYVAGLTRFVEDNKIGFANKQGEKVIPANFDFAYPFDFSEQITFVCNGGQEKVVKSSDGELLYTEIIGGKWGAINRKGDIIVPLEFDEFKTDSNDNFVIFIKDNKPYKLYHNKRGEYKILP